jgi:hypothetical protein
VNRPAQVALYLARKIAGQCVRCGKSCDGNSVYCAAHHEEHKATQRDRYRARPRNPNSRIKCRRCGGRGHFAKTCVVPRDL